MDDFLDILTAITLAVFSIGTFRDAIAFHGFIPRNKKFSWIIYGKHDEELLKRVLIDLGYSDQMANTTKTKIKQLIKEEQRKNGISSNNAIEKLIAILCKYTMEFPEQIKYGGEDKASNFYIDTMEASLTNEDLQIMTSLMLLLINKKCSKKPDVIFVSKKGNVILAKSVARMLNAQLVIIKDENDDSRASSIDNSDVSVDYYKVNFEGSWNLFDGKQKTSIVIDCNTSSGNQLIKTITEINNAIAQCNMKINAPKDIFVLYRADNTTTNIDEKFSDHKCRLHRYIDLDEQLKKELSSIKTKNSNINLNDIYDQQYSQCIESCKQYLKNNNLIYSECKKEQQNRNKTQPTKRTKQLTIKNLFKK